MKTSNGSIATLLGLGLAGWLIYELTRSSSSDDDKKEPDMPSTNREEAIALIRAKARAAGVPEHIALAFADVESNFNPRAEGDRKWHERKDGELYRKNVRDNPRLKENPARLDPPAWHSYGLFQLLAPYFVEPAEHPRVLLDPEVNATRAMKVLKRLHEAYAGDTDKMRIHYAAGSLHVSDEVRNQVLSRFQPALEKWKAAEGVT
jgi:soluble lytic murein transglycosylase-like protein